jgi:hypothetical protein
MRDLLITLVLAGVSVAAPSQSETAKQAKPPFSIIISTETPTIKAGAGLEIRIRLTNLSGRDINGVSNIENRVDVSYEQEVRDSTGRLAKREHWNPEVVIVGATHFNTLKPGESGDSVTVVDPKYDISKPGQYVIQLSRTIAGTIVDDRKDGVVKSNKITITVTP